MALQVWLPLNKEEDFQNKGLADITVKGSPEYDSNGKIGGCYKNYSGKYLTISHNISDTTEFSFTYWINIPSTITQAKAQQQFMTFSGKSNDVLGKAVVTWVDYNQLKWYDSTGWDQKLWQSFSYDTWYHISVVHTSGNFKIYINGELESRNYNTSSILKLTAGNIIIGNGLNSTYSKVKFNDFRVYNHCLSPKEVKEISKGLVLHYPLNKDFYLDKLSNITIYPEHQYYFTTTLKKIGTPSYCYSVIKPYDIDGKFIHHYHTLKGFDQATKTTLAKDLNPGDSVIYCTDLSNWNTKANSYFYRVSIMGYKDSHGRLYPDYTQDSPEFGNYADVKTNINKTNNTITLNSAFTGAQRKAGTIIYQATQGADFYYPFMGTANKYDDWKKHETTFYPKNIDRLRYAKTVDLSSLYAIMKDTMLKDLDTYFISDCSGYCNNGTIASNLTTSDNTPRYDKCTVNTSDYPLYTTLNFPESKGLTISCWVKLTSFGVQTSGLWATSNNLTPSDYENTACNHRDSGFDIKGSNRISYRLTCNANHIPLNQWKHVVFTHDGNTAKLFINSEEKTSVSVPTSLVSFKYFFLGWSEAGGVRRRCNGNWSDLRIYSTALSDEDIKELYNTSTMIDNSGNLLTYQIIE